MAQALPNYAMSVFLKPHELSKDIERSMCRYWWTSTSCQMKSIHWMSWDRMCKSKSVGGLGFRSLYDSTWLFLGSKGGGYFVFLIPWLADYISPDIILMVIFSLPRLEVHPVLFGVASWKHNS